MLRPEDVGPPLEQGSRRGAALALALSRVD